MPDQDNKKTAVKSILSGVVSNAIASAFATPLINAGSQYIAICTQPAAKGMQNLNLINYGGLGARTVAMFLTEALTKNTAESLEKNLGFSKQTSNIVPVALCSLASTAVLAKQETNIIFGKENYWILARENPFPAFMIAARDLFSNIGLNAPELSIKGKAFVSGFSTGISYMISLGSEGVLGAIQNPKPIILPFLVSSSLRTCVFALVPIIKEKTMLATNSILENKESTPSAFVSRPESKDVNNKGKNIFN